MHEAISYLHLAPESSLPEIANEPTRMIVIVEAEVSPAWQSLVSDWIVRCGCLYMMAWGIECSSWDDSVDWAYLDQYDTCAIPEGGFVATSWFPDEPLEEVFWFAKNVASYSLVDIQRTVLLHISTTENRDRLMAAFEAA